MCGNLYVLQFYENKESMIDVGSCHPYAINLESLDWFDDVEKKSFSISAFQNFVLFSHFFVLQIIFKSFIYEKSAKMTSSPICSYILCNEKKSWFPSVVLDLIKGYFFHHV